jgi:IPT/TIG domain
MTGLLAVVTGAAAIVVTASPAYATGAPSIVGMPGAGVGGVGSTLGGTTILINGTNFSTVNATVPESVTFGGVDAVSFIVFSSTQLSAVAPANAVDGAVVDVRITNSVGTSAVTVADRFTYRAPITATVEADTLLNPMGGGQFPVTIDLLVSSADDLVAKNLTATIAGVAAPVGWVSANSATHSSVLSLTVPAGTPSATPVPVVVYRDTVPGIPDDTDARYAAVITSLSVPSGPVAGDPTATVLVTGKGLADSTQWQFGAADASCAATSTALADTSWTCTSVPPAPVSTAGPYAGPVALTFVSATGPFGYSSGGIYTYTDLH